MKGNRMKIMITQIDNTGIDPNHYSVGDVVEAIEDTHGKVRIPMPNSPSSFDYLLLPEWFITLGAITKDHYNELGLRPVVEQSLDRYDS